MRASKFSLLIAAFGVLAMVTTSSAQDLLPRDNGIYDYHPTPAHRDGNSHPLRVIAYVLHPIGWIAREAIFRPLSSLAASTEFSRSFMGYREPLSHREPICFSKGDEYPDCKSLPPISSISYSPSVTSGGDSVASMSSTGMKQVYFPDVAFEFDHAKLNALGRGRVRQVAQLLAANPSVSVVVEGHTDSVGSAEYNDKLGSSRADAVVKELTELGIDPARLSGVTKGKAQPVFTEEEDWAHAVNRRVQFVVGG